MVRHKNRWMLVRLDFASIEEENMTTSSILFPSTKDLMKAIRENIVSCFGIAATCAASDVQGKFLKNSSTIILDMYIEKKLFTLSVIFGLIAHSLKLFFMFLFY